MAPLRGPPITQLYLQRQTTSTAPRILKRLLTYTQLLQQGRNKTDAKGQQIAYTYDSWRA